MIFKALALTGLTIAAIAVSTHNAQAMNLLVAVGNPQIRIILTEDGTLQIIEQDQQETVQVSNIEPAAGSQDISLER